MRKIIMTTAVVLLVAAACGGDSGSLSDAIDDAGNGGSGDTAASDSGSDSSDSSDSGDSGDSGDSDGGSDSGDSDTDGGDVGAGSNTEFCRFNEQINTELEATDFTSGDPAEVEAGYRLILDNIDRAVAIAPDQIRADVAILADGFKGIAEFLEEYGWDFRAVPVDALESDPRMADASSPQYEQAGNRVDDFCGFDDEPAAGDGGADEGDLPDVGVVDEETRRIVIQGLQVAFGWDADLAACVVDELGLDDPTTIDPSAFGDPDDKVCGQSMTELFGG